MIGIIGAMDEEVAQIVEVMQVERKESKAFPCSLSKWQNFLQCLKHQ